MLILNESPEVILASTLIAKSKLKSMKNHLVSLLAKKARIENEVKILQKSIKNKSKSLEIHLKTKINLEAFNSDIFTLKTTQEFLESELPEVIPHILEWDELQLEIQEILEELSEEEDKI